MSKSEIAFCVVVAVVAVGWWLNRKGPPSPPPLEGYGSYRHWRRIIEEFRDADPPPKDGP